MSRLSPSTLRAALWALRATRRARVALRREPLDAAIARLPRVPDVPAGGRRGVEAVMRRREDTCLVRAIVMQAWNAAHGDRRDLVIGVTGSRDFKAHAWLDGDPAPESDEFTELHRHPAAR